MHKTFTILETNKCPVCGKMDYTALCSQCRNCSAFLEEWRESSSNSS